MKNETRIDDRHIDVIDGIRAMSVIIVLIFHFWQQTWIFPRINTPWLSFIKLGGRALTSIDFTPFARVGYVFVDMMVLLSGFLLAVPLARHIFNGEPLESVGKFYKKRAVRILPSYLFCIAVIFVYELINGGYAVNGVTDVHYALRDLFTHLTFTHMMRVDTYVSTKLNTVLWTLAVEVWFYLLFPFIRFLVCGRKGRATGGEAAFRMTAASAALIGLSHLYIYKYALANGSKTAAFIDGTLAKLGSTVHTGYFASVINQLPAFFGVYGIGMIGALAFVLMAKHLKRSRLTAAVSTVFAFAAIWLIVYMVKDCASLSVDSAQHWQVQNRMTLAAVFMFFILTASLSARWFRSIFSNPVMRFLSAISYNLYIWHQWLCVKIKYDWRLPAWTGDTPPNQLGTPEGKAWSGWYALIITVAAFAVAALVTYLIEKPAADMLNGRPSIYTGKLKKKKAERQSQASGK